MTLTKRYQRLMKPIALTLGAMLCISTLPAGAADGGAQLKDVYYKSIAGKTIAFLPMTLGRPADGHVGIRDPHRGRAQQYEIFGQRSCME